MSFIDNGRIVNGLVTARLFETLSSPNKDRNALVLNYVTRQNLVINGASYGPYKDIDKVVFSGTGQAWAASAFTDFDRVKLIMPGSTDVEYDAVRDMKGVNGRDAVIYNGFRDNRWFPRVNGQSLGTYNQAFLDCSSSGSSAVYLVANEGDNLLKTYRITLQ